MGKIMICALLCTLLAGCPATTQFVRVETQRVEVPVALPLPKIVLPTRPELELTKVNKDTPDVKVIEAYKITIIQLQTYAKQLEVLLSAVNSSRIDDTANAE